MKKWIMVIAAVYLAVSTASAASVISLDGSFSDWEGMPFYGKNKDYQYFYDQDDNNLYLYAQDMGERLSVMLKNGEDNYSAEVTRQDGDVEVSLYKGNDLLHTSSGSWASEGEAEFAIPMDDLTQGAQWGYEIRFKLSGEKWAVISTANTSPVMYLVIVIVAGILIPLLVLAWRKKRRRNV